MLKKTILIIILFSLKSYSQDVAFTQSFMVPESINPSFSGFYQTTKAGLLYKNQQWSGLDFNLNSQYFFLDDWYPELNSGIGISLLNHQETFTNYSLKQLNVSWAYDVQINYDWHFRPSVTAGFATKDFGFDNLLFEDQVNIYQNIINSNSYDPIALGQNSRYIDLGASFLFNNDNNWIGVTLRHLNRPNISMVDQIDVSLDIFMSVHASLELPILRYNDDGNTFFITNFIKQAKYNRFDFGIQHVYDRFSFALTATTNLLQTSDQSHLITSINPIIGIAWEGFKFGYSYDLNLSKMGGNGGVSEFSIVYDFLNDKECFGCPDY
jgi:type IX secretion system PorP/SprF family membrane protein